MNKEHGKLHAPGVFSMCLLVVFMGLSCHGQHHRPSLNEFSRPNIVVVLSDDQGYAHLGSFADQYDATGMDPRLIAAANNCMPTVDRLAAEGMRFVNCHATPTCFPSRVMLMSARYPQNLGVYSNKDFTEAGGPDPAVVFPVNALKEAGYKTAMIGKWHLGSKTGMHPNDRGFDYFFGFDSSQTEKYESKILYQNKTKAPAVGFLADQLTDEASRYIRNAGGEPFFLYLCYNEPHGPRPTPPTKYSSKFDTGSQKNNEFYGYINSVDVGVDSVLRALEDAGQMGNTIILFASDNGATDWMPAPSGGDLRGFKRSVYEGGVRVPMVAWWPGHIPVGRTNTDLVSFVDIMPTLLDAVDVDIPASQAYDGRSFLPQLLQTTNDEFRRGPLCWAGDSYPDDPAWKSAWNQWKEDNPEEWSFGFFPPGWYVIKGKWKLVDDGYKGSKLYDLSSDIGEKYDLSGENPEVTRELEKDFIAYMKNKPEPLGWYRGKWKEFFKVGKKDNKGKSARR